MNWGFLFHILTLTLPHPPLTNTSLGDWIWTSAIGEGDEYKITLFSPAIIQVRRLNLLNLQVCNYRCECSQCRVRVRVTHRSLFTWSSSWRNVAGSLRRMIRENTEFPLDAIWNKKATFPQSYADLADFRCTFTLNGRREFVPRDQVFPLFYIYCLYTKISSVMLFLTIGIVRDCFYLLIFAVCGKHES